QEVPVYFVYITAWSAKDGVVQFRDDIYEKDGNAELALSTTSGMEQPAGAVDDDLLPRN
ncbi:MAG: murein L,D-transpeptidase, partial [Agrobacterium sp.]|nr:murein L,D-transpeptidase [Agrobacterium sp.]